MAARAGTAKSERGAAKAGPDAAASWTFLTNHAHVFICVASDPTLRVRDLAARVGITERAVLRILRELEDAGYLTHERDGRRNVYRVRASLPFRHPVERHQKVGVLLDLFASPRP